MYTVSLLQQVEMSNCYGCQSICHRPHHEWQQPCAGSLVALGPPLWTYWDQVISKEVMSDFFSQIAEPSKFVLTDQVVTRNEP